MAKTKAKTPFFAWIVIAILVLIILQRLANSASTIPNYNPQTPYAPGSNLPGPYASDLPPVQGPPAPGAPTTASSAAFTAEPLASA